LQFFLHVMGRPITLMFITLMFITLMCSCDQSEIEFPEKSGLVRMIDPTGNIPKWEWDRRQKLSAVNTDILERPVVANVGEVWRKAIVLNISDEFTKQFEIEGPGVFEFSAIGVVANKNDSSSKMLLHLQIKTGNGCIEKEIELKTTDSPASKWMNFSIPVRNLSGSCTCSMRMTWDNQDVKPDAAQGLIASMMFVPDEIVDKPNVIMWAFDSLRSDELGAYGSPLANSPTLDELSRQGILFSESTSTSSWTVPGVKNMMAGLVTQKYIDEHLPFSRSKEFDIPLVQSEFANAGYMTIGISSNHLVSPDNGIDKGFDVFDVVASKLWVSGSVLMLYKRIEEMLRKYDDRPLFLYIHAMDPHDPYTPFAPYNKICNPPEDNLVHPRLCTKDTGMLNFDPFKTELQPLSETEERYIRSYYRGEIRQMDSYFFAVLSLMKSKGLLKNTIVSITADHGEEFGEHELYSHGWSLYEGAVRVPWILYYPHQIAQPLIHPGRVSTLDIPQTILRVAGIETEAPFQGMCLYPVNTDYSHKRCLVSLLRSNDDDDTSRWQTRCVYSGKRKLMWESGIGLKGYDLESDPNELSFQEWGDWEEFYASQISPEWKSIGIELDKLVKNTIRKETPMGFKMKEQLRQLGYIQ